MNEIDLTSPESILLLMFLVFAIIGITRDLFSGHSLWNEWLMENMTPKIEREVEEENNGGE